MNHIILCYVMLHHIILFYWSSAAACRSASNHPPEFAVLHATAARGVNMQVWSTYINHQYQASMAGTIPQGKYECIRSVYLWSTYIGGASAVEHLAAAQSTIRLLGSRVVKL